MHTCFAIPVVRLGRRAKNYLRGGTGGKVAAVFARSFYLETESGMLACFGSPSVGIGPLNCVCDISSPLDFRSSGLREHATFYVVRNLVRIGGRFEFSLEGAEVWQPPGLPGRITRSNLARNLARLVSTARARLPTSGLGFLIASNDVKLDDNPLGVQVKSALAPFTQWLRLALDAGTAQLPRPPAEAVMLIGLGPGLTPSGDDFIGGVMIALRFVGRCDIAEILAEWALPLVRVRSNAISAAHLAAAAAGETAEGVHHVLVGLGSPKTVAMNTNLDAIDNIGHTSGWDTLAGSILVCSLFVRCHLTLADGIQ